MDFSSAKLHFLFEALAYFVGIRAFLMIRKRQGTTHTAQTSFIWVLVGAVCGAALGSKLIFWFHRPDLWPQTMNDLPQWFAGKTVVGGFLGGVIGVELAKWRIGLKQGTGDLFVFPVMLGLMIGRVGCFFGGIHDGTHGLPTNLPWAIDFGDGIGRHPTQLYEIVFVALCFAFLYGIRYRFPKAGDGFKLFMGTYLLWRLGSGFLKPRQVLYALQLSGIQWTSILGLFYYGPHLIRIGGTLCQRK